MEKPDKKPTAFQPSELQLKILQKAMNMDSKPTITALCAHELDDKGEKIDGTGINRDTWYEWNKNPAFCEWWQSMWDLHMSRMMFALDKIAWLKASKDFRYMELLQMKYAKYRKKHDVTSDDKPISTPIDLIAATLLQTYKDNADKGEENKTEQSGSTGNPDSN